MDAITFSTLSPAGDELLRGCIPEEWHGNNRLLREFLLSFAMPHHVTNQTHTYSYKH
jgi:hypothetical protein